MARDPEKGPDLGYYALAQVGVEMAAPVGLGWWLDSTFDCFPWLTVVGAISGLVIGLYEITRYGAGGSGKAPGKPPGNDEK